MDVWEKLDDLLLIIANIANKLNILWTLII
jgi:hypothetical protein